MCTYLVTMEQSNEKQNKVLEADIVPADLLPKTIDDFMGDELKRMFGEEVVKLFVADRKQIPHVELQIHNAPQGRYTKVTVKLLFHNKLIATKMIFAF